MYLLFPARIRQKNSLIIDFVHDFPALPAALFRRGIKCCKKGRIGLKKYARSGIIFLSVDPEKRDWKQKERKEKT